MRGEWEVFEHWGHWGFVDSSDVDSRASFVPYQVVERDRFCRIIWISLGSRRSRSDSSWNQLDRFARCERYGYWLVGSSVWFVGESRCVWCGFIDIGDIDLYFACIPYGISDNKSFLLVPRIGFREARSYCVAASTFRSVDWFVDNDRYLYITAGWDTWIVVRFFVGWVLGIDSSDTYSGLSLVPYKIVERHRRGRIIRVASFSDGGISS
jgi:hypothetical protein